MGKTSNETKQRWNEAHYVQIKVNVKPEIAEAFKAACKNAGVSMAEVLSRSMADYSNAAAKIKAPIDKTRTRGLRRESVKAMIRQLELIRDAEEAYMDNIPDNLKSSSKFDDANGSIAALEDVLALLEDAY